jgi:KipI family sensor histidine kinase inhibitor
MKAMNTYRITIAGDSALNLVFAEKISAESSALIREAAAQLEGARIPGVREFVPTFCSLMVCYDPLVVGYDELCRQISDRLTGLAAPSVPRRRVVELPVCYGGEFGPDLPFVAEHAGMTEDEVVALHSGRDYVIDMLGFLPGFAYLGGLDERLHTPRLETPRTVIPAGSVGICGAQTGVYPLDSPGGWRLIVRTPARPYDPAREEPILYAAGDCLRFVPITPAQFSEIAAQVAAGTYVCPTSVREEA